MEERSRPVSTLTGSFAYQLSVMLLSTVILSGCGGRSPVGDPRVSTAGKRVSVEIAEVEEKGFGFFTYLSDSGVTVDFFVYRDGSGAPRAALDACRKCYRWLRGYIFEGNTWSAANAASASMSTPSTRAAAPAHRKPSLRRGMAAPFAYRPPNWRPERHISKQ